MTTSDWRGLGAAIVVFMFVAVDICLNILATSSEYFRSWKGEPVSSAILLTLIRGACFAILVLLFYGLTV